jgi:hypothetical protein
MRARVTDDDKIAMERIPYRVFVGTLARDYPKFRVDILLQGKRSKAPAHGRGFSFLRGSMVRQDARDCLPAYRKGSGRIPFSDVGQAVDPNQVRATPVGKLGGIRTDLRALGSVIEKNPDGFPVRHHVLSLDSDVSLAPKVGAATRTWPLGGAT